MPNWTYDPRLKGSGYRDLETGRILSRDQARDLVAIQISAGEDVSAVMSTLYTGGQISPDDWRTSFRQEIKDQYITQYLEGRGGRSQMSQADWGSVGGMIADQYRYLEGFYGELSDPENEFSDEYISARMNMYINSSREAYERAIERSADDHGWIEHAWILGDTEHCEDCLDLASDGFKPVSEPFLVGGKETLPGMGDTICLTNCDCHVDYKDEEGVTIRISAQQIQRMISIKHTHKQAALSLSL